MRDRCIERCTASPSVKVMMHRAFEAGTDTEQMWGLLRINCTLLPPEKVEAEPLAPPLGGTKPIGVAEPPSAAPSRSSPPPSTVHLPPRQPPTTPPFPRKERWEPEKEAPPLRCCLVSRDGRHRIALAMEGEIVLGRFDPTSDANPDIDLSYDNRKSMTASRRHARIVTREGQPAIEDLGSANGTFVNDRQIEAGQRTMLQPGDQITLGNLNFVCEVLPPLQALSLHREPTACLWVTFTGHRFLLPTKGEMVVGRQDPEGGFVPDIDLSKEGDVSLVVSRRHIRISAQDGRHHVEDLGSANGTRLNGARIRAGEPILLEPGDHLWLGGCVLAYDVETRAP